MATYNCTNDTSSAYGSGGYGTCTGQSVGAPNTGLFQQVIDGGSVTILGPLAVAVILASVVAVIARRKTRKDTVTPSSPLPCVTDLR